MKTSWTKGLSKEQTEDIKYHFKEGKYLRNKLQKMLEDKLSLAEKASVATELYESPNWAAKQADTVGYKRALYEIISLLED